MSLRSRVAAVSAGCLLLAGALLLILLIPRKGSLEEGPGEARRIASLDPRARVVPAEAHPSDPAPPRPTITFSLAGRELAPFPLERGGTVSGRVLDPAGSPIAGARVILFSPSSSEDEGWKIRNLHIQTDREGRYSLEGYPRHGDYVAIAQHEDHAPGSVHGISLGPGESREGVEIRLTEGGTIRGRVLDDQGRAIDLAMVRAVVNPAGLSLDERLSGLYSFGRVTTDEEGNYEVRHLNGKRYDVSAERDDLISGSREAVAVSEGRTTEIDIVMRRGNSVSGRVTDADGHPIPFAAVEAEKIEPMAGMISGGSPTILKGVKTDAEGTFFIGGIGEEDEVRVNARKGGYAPEGIEAKLPAEGVSIRLERIAVIAGVLRAKDRDAFPDSDLTLFEKTAGSWFRSDAQLRADAGGEFEIDVPKGLYRIEAQVPGYARGMSPDVAVAAGERREGVVIDLSPGGRIEGKVILMGSREPVPRAKVFLRRAGSLAWVLPNTTTEGGGWFVLDGVPEGMADLVVLAWNFPRTLLPGLAIGAGETKTVMVEIPEPSGGVRGVVLRDGKPAEGLSIDATKLDGGEVFEISRKTESGGRFQFAGLLPGEYRLSVSDLSDDGGGYRTERRLTVRDQRFTEVEIDADRGIRVAGRVTSRGSPVQEGSIEALDTGRGWMGMRVWFDREGSYWLHVPRGGSYSFHFVLEGFETFAQAEIPDGRRDFRQDFEFSGGEISGTVVDGPTGKPLEAEIEACASNSFPKTFACRFRALRGNAIADRRGGRFALSGLSPGTYSIAIAAEGHAENWIDGIQVGEGRTSLERPIELERGVAFQVKAADPEGLPIDVQGASAIVQYSDGRQASSKEVYDTSRDGVIEIQGVRPGDHTLIVSHPRFAPARTEIHVGPDGGEQALTLRPGGGLLLQVVDPRGKPVDGAEAHVLDERGEDVAQSPGSVWWRLRSTGTDRDGVLVLDHLNPGTYRVFAGKGPLRSADQKVQVQEGTTEEVRLVLLE